MRLFLYGFLAILLVAVYADCSEAQSSLVVPGGVTVGDDVDATGNLTGAYLTLSKNATFADYSCATIVQCIMLQWDEGAATAKAWPDTFGKLAKRKMFTAPVDCTIYSVTLEMAGAGSAWDSLKVDLLAGDSGDSTVFSTTPMLEPGDGDYSNSIADGRTGVLNSTIANLAAGETVFIEGEAHGNKADAPSGVVVTVMLTPDY